MKAALFIAAVILAGCAAAAPAPSERLPVAAYDPPVHGLQTAVLSGGCFWGVQGVFEHVRGVTKVWAGYDGGQRGTAHYDDVSTGITGHAESVEITFDPAQISYGEVLRIFFSVATDPTQLNHQVPDEGPQYRSEIFFRTPEQRLVAVRYIAQLGAARAFAHPIVTRVDPDHGFFRAEDHHQDYLVHHPRQPYIALYDAPKLQQLKALFPQRWRADPVLAL
ncbi:MAG TPA: peptide-methionine (S)-S-oxide reductase MsrA [Caulobacteraceae bacterium]|jgi:peptide-methionine (S)-S-oxide reductase